MEIKVLFEEKEYEIFIVNAFGPYTRKAVRKVEYDDINWFIVWYGGCDLKEERLALIDQRDGLFLGLEKAYQIYKREEKLNRILDGD